MPWELLKSFKQGNDVIGFFWLLSGWQRKRMTGLWASQGGERSLMWLWEWRAKKNDWRPRSSELEFQRCWGIHLHGCWTLPTPWWCQAKGLGVKKQREVNQWKQYWDYKGGLYWAVSREERGEWPCDSDHVLPLLSTHLKSQSPTEESPNILALSCTIPLNSLVSHCHLPQHHCIIEFSCSHLSPFAHTVVSQRMSVPSSHLCKNLYSPSIA